MSSDGLIFELRNVSRGYRFFKLQDISLALEPGQILGLVGPNGAGKSTTLRILMGFIRPDAGQVRIGKDMFADTVYWSTAALAILGIEIAIIAISFGFLLWITGREPEVV